MLRLAVPDLVSNSYFPAIAAVELGFFRVEGLDVELELVSPLDACMSALRAGDVDLVGASAHAPLLAFPEWQGAKLLCAHARGLYWHLVMRKDLAIERGDLAALRGRRIAAVPFVGTALKRILNLAGFDATEEGIDICVPASAARPGTNFGVAAAEALRSGEIDGFFANGMGAECAVRDGVGDLVLDVRRGDGPEGCFGFTFPAIATTDRLVEKSPDVAAAIVRAIANVQTKLRDDPTAAEIVGRALFPAREATLIADVVGRDTPFYDAVITPRAIEDMNAYCRSVGLLRGAPNFHDVVASAFQRVSANERKD
jgi:NitT/TauT family transport system substrate-binding protein